MAITGIYCWIRSWRPSAAATGTITENIQVSKAKYSMNLDTANYFFKGTIVNENKLAGPEYDQF